MKMRFETKTFTRCNFKTSAVFGGAVQCPCWLSRATVSENGLLTINTEEDPTLGELR